MNNLSGQKKSEKDGQFLAVYDWDKIVSDVCTRYANGENIDAILKTDGYPCWASFYRAVFGGANPDYLALYDAAGHGKAAFFDSQFDDIVKDADKAFKDKKLNPNALKVKLDTLKLQRGHLNPKYRDREVKHTIELGVSMREELTKARQRLESRNVIEGEVIEG